jgi:membrane-associated protease RseP (regulator of RpoE activity)
MGLLLLLILLGLITYFIVKRSVASITQTPVWLLWLVMMTPALVWSGWTLVNGQDKPMPPELVLGPFLVCLPLYWLLIHWGRKAPNPTVSKGTDEKTTDTVEQKSVVGPTVEKPTLRPITQQEETKLRNCFPWGIYYLQNLEFRPQAVLCRGKLRTNPEKAYQKVRENIEAEFGDRFFVIFQESLNGIPFFAIVPNPQTRQTKEKTDTKPVTRPILGLMLLLMTLFTTTTIGAKFAVGSLSIKQLISNPEILLQGLPYALALMSILGIHELGHYLIARSYKIRTTLPYFIPEPLFLGTFGAFIQMRQPVPNRKALFDIGIAGPLAGLIITLPILIWGLAHSSVVPLTKESGLFNFESLNPRFSLLLTLLSKLALGSALIPNMAIDLHPLALAGYIGLIVTALNLMPVGQLDGGHIVHAMFGQRTGAAIGQISRLLVLILAWKERELLLWAIILLLMPSIDEPALNDVSEVDNWRDLCGLLSLVLLVSIVLPPPATITQLLHI